MGFLPVRNEVARKWILDVFVAIEIFLQHDRD